MFDPIVFESISRLTIKVTPGDDKRPARVALSFEAPLDPNHIAQVLGLVARRAPLSVSISSVQLELPFGEAGQEDHPEATRRPRRKVPA